MQFASGYGGRSGALYMGIGLSEHEVWVLSSQLERAMEVLGPLLES